MAITNIMVTGGKVMATGTRYPVADVYVQHPYDYGGWGGDAEFRKHPIDWAWYWHQHCELIRGVVGAIGWAILLLVFA